MSENKGQSNSETAIQEEQQIETTTNTQTTSDTVSLPTNEIADAPRILLAAGSATDIAQIDALNRRTMPENHSLEFYDKFFKMPNTFVLLAWHDPVPGSTRTKVAADMQLVGYAMVSAGFDQRGKKSSLLFSLAVDASFRRRGIATLLIRNCVHTLQTKQVEYMTVIVRKKNNAARKLFCGRLDFNNTKTLKKYYPKPKKDDGLLMIKRFVTNVQAQKKPLQNVVVSSQASK